MRVLVIGASGRTGSLTTVYALKKGYTVTVLVRKTSSVEPQQGLTIVEGSPLNKDDVKRAFNGTPEDPVKAVIVALAASRASDSPFAKPLAPQWLLRDSQRNIQEQMRAHNVRRLVAMSAFGSGSSWSQFPLPFKLLFRASNMIHELRDHDEVDKELRHAGEEWNLQWTLAKPTLLKGEQLQLREMGETGKGVGLTDSTSREGVARWLFDAVESNAHLQQACVLIN